MELSSRCGWELYDTRTATLIAGAVLSITFEFVALWVPHFLVQWLKDNNDWMYVETTEHPLRVNCLGHF